MIVGSFDSGESIVKTPAWDWEFGMKRSKVGYVSRSENMKGTRREPGKHAEKKPRYGYVYMRRASTENSRVKMCSLHANVGCDLPLDARKGSYVAK